MTTSQGDRPLVVIRYGTGKHSVLLKVPPGHLAVVRRHEDIPSDIRSCAAKLAKYKGPISAKTRRIMIELSKRS